MVRKNGSTNLVRKQRYLQLLVGTAKNSAISLQYCQQLRVLRDSDHRVRALQTRDPSSRQKGRPTETRQQVSYSNVPTGSNIWSQVPEWDRPQDSLAVSRKVTWTSRKVAGWCEIAATLQGREARQQSNVYCWKPLPRTEVRPWLSKLVCAWQWSVKCGHELSAVVSNKPDYQSKPRLQSHSITWKCVHIPSLRCPFQTLQVNTIALVQTPEVTITAWLSTQLRNTRHGKLTPTSV
jgi:hypothetical protein